MNILYFDCQSGISGDMAVGAFLDMGIELTALARKLSKMKLPAVYDIEAEKVRKNGTAATAFRVLAERAQGVCSLYCAEEWISESGLADNAKSGALRALRLLTDAREKVYGESGQWLRAADAIACAVNLTAAAVCIGWTGADTVVCSPLTEGNGFAETRSGLVRLPVPTVTELARMSGAPFEICAEKTQLVTETGAALVSAFAQNFRVMPSMTVSSVGFGAGLKDLDTRANVLRVILGKNEYRFFAESVCVIESDSACPESFWQCRTGRNGAKKSYE